LEEATAMLQQRDVWTKGERALKKNFASNTMADALKITISDDAMMQDCLPFAFSIRNSGVWIPSF
jgi:hypothetical protein